MKHSPEDLAKADNFYSFLHKRWRFFPDGVRMNGALVRNYYPYNIKNIDIEEVWEDTSRGYPRLLASKLLDKFGGWKDDAHYAGLAGRLVAGAESVCGPGRVRHWEATPEWRLVLGGGGSVFETSLLLHPVHGFPYLPASSLKGLARSWVLERFFATAPDSEADYPLTNAEHRALTTSEDFCRMFGCPAESRPVLFKDGKPEMDGSKRQKLGKAEPVALHPNESLEHQGELSFFDALPAASPRGKIVVDLVNPHVPEYYRERPSASPPTDTQQPIPVMFLAVERLPFRFVLGQRPGSRGGTVSLGDQRGPMLEVAATALRSALSDKGLGAKTAVGYGFFV